MAHAVVRAHRHQLRRISVCSVLHAPQIWSARICALACVPTILARFVPPLCDIQDASTYVSPRATRYSQRCVSLRIAKISLPVSACITSSTASQVLAHGRSGDSAQGAAPLSEIAVNGVGVRVDLDTRVSEELHEEESPVHAASQSAGAAECYLSFTSHTPGRTFHVHLQVRVFSRVRRNTGLDLAVRELNVLMKSTPHVCVNAGHVKPAYTRARIFIKQR